MSMSKTHTLILSESDVFRIVDALEVSVRYYREIGWTDVAQSNQLLINEIKHDTDNIQFEQQPQSKSKLKRLVDDLFK